MTAENILQIFNDRVQRTPNRTALRFRRDGLLKQWTWAQWSQAASRLAEQLVLMGVGEGDRVVLISDNRPEWLAADLAIMSIGAVCVPIYADTLPRHCAWTLANADADWMITDGPLQLRKLAGISESLEGLRGCVVFDEEVDLEVPDASGRMSLSIAELELPPELADVLVPFSADGVLNETADAAVLNDTQSREALASIVYTSGTMGTPRGVRLSHGNFVAQVVGNASVMPISGSDRQILLLPLSQIFARAIYMTCIFLGAETYISSGLRYLSRELQAEKPTFFVGVPGVFERLSAQFATKSSSSRFYGRRRIRRMARAAIRKSRAEQGRGSLSLADRMLLGVADRTFFEAFRQVFGGELRFAISGGAPLSSSVCEIFHGAGMPILEGYGLTETCGAATVNRLDRLLSGSVGQVIPGVEVRISDEGEVLLRGPSVSDGYWRDPDSTAAAFDDGWLRTGDVGELVTFGMGPAEQGSEDVYLRITERMDDIVVVDTGMKVSPQRIETQLRSIPLVRTAVVSVGESSRVYALLNLDRAVLKAWARQQGRAAERYETLATDAGVYESLKAEVDQINATLRPSEQVAAFAVIPQLFSAESGEMTQTFKVRRRFVIEKYRSVLDAIRVES